MSIFKIFIFLVCVDAHAVSFYSDPCLALHNLSMQTDADLLTCVRNHTDHCKPQSDLHLQALINEETCSARLKKQFQ
jgi:hypothetical protein